MLSRKNTLLIAVVAAALHVSTSAYADQPTGEPAVNTPIEHRVYKVSPVEYLTPVDREHPLVPSLQLAYDGIQYLQQNVKDYTCRLVARERVNGHLGAHQYMDVKIRHVQERDEQVVVPFAVHLRFRGPPRIKGREVLYVQGLNKGQLLARNGGSSNLQDVTLSLDPLSPRAMRDQRYPLTEIGLKTLGQRLIEVGHEALQLDRERRECEVKMLGGAKIDGRACRVIQVKFPVRRPNLRFHVARIFVDDERPIPLRYEAYSWPREEGQPPLLLEEYTYLDIKLNVGLTDLDFQRDNPAYQFYRGKPPEKSVSEIVNSQ